VRDGAYAWRGHRVHFERGGCDPAVATKHVVFLHGFGVGTFHYERQLDHLGALVDAETNDGKTTANANANTNATTCVWALDFVGQGASWPCDANASSFPYVDEEGAAPEGFRYSVDTWRDQVLYFLTEIVQPGPAGAYLAGNSLGGYVAALVAATEILSETREEESYNETADSRKKKSKRRLVHGLVLLNATPFWAFVPSDEKSLARRVTPWDGKTPAPRWIQKPFETYWDAFRSEANVKGLLSLVYGDGKKRVDERLVRDIIAPTDRKPALTAFCSVVFSPKSEVNFDEITRVIRDDKQKMPVWGQRMKRAVPRATYYELPGVGHCPAHEAPEETNVCVAAFVRRCEATDVDVADESLVGEKSIESAFASGDAAARFLVDGAPRNVFEKLAAWRETRTVET
jgi:pimeloyl-ACP methyl ester carboxylesterase